MVVGVSRRSNWTFGEVILRDIQSVLYIRGHKPQCLSHSGNIKKKKKKERTGAICRYTSCLNGAAASLLQPVFVRRAGRTLDFVLFLIIITFYETPPNLTGCQLARSQVKGRTSQETAGDVLLGTC